MSILRALKCRMEVPEDLIDCLEKRTRDKNVGLVSSVFQHWLVLWFVHTKTKTTKLFLKEIQTEFKFCLQA